MMRWLFIICGALATAAMIAISMRLNFLFGTALGQTPEKALVFGCVSVVADAWKGLAPIFIVTLLRERKVWTTVAASAVWFACFVFSVSSAVGITIQDRTTITGGRETLRANYDATRSEIEEMEGKVKALPHHRSAGEIETAIGALLSQPIGSAQRVRGTLGTLSANCTKADARTAQACAEVAVLRQKLAVAAEGTRLDDRLAQLWTRARTLREHGGGQASDPQAALLSRLTHGWLAAGDVGPSLALLLASVIELVSAFGPVVLAAYADATQNVVGRRGNESPAVMDYMIECIEPDEQGSAISADAIFADYRRWCASKRKKPLPITAFIAAFDRSRIEHGLQDIRKLGNAYHGIRLADLICDH